MPWSDRTSSIQLNTWELMGTECSGVGESPNIVRNRMVFDSVDFTVTFAPGFVSWCVCEQCEVPKAGTAQISCSGEEAQLVEADQERESGF